jgi:hypothetical protein
MIEQALRESGDSRALQAQQQALVERYLELAGAEFREAIEAYTTLTLARHIFLSTKFLDRANFTVPLLELCERRLEQS